MSAATADEKQPIPNQVFVGGMKPETSVEQLTKHFQGLKLSPTGPPTFFRTPDGGSKGCALVPFASPEAVAAAITALDGSKLGDLPLVAREDRGPRKRREVNQDGTYLYVGNLDPDVTVDELHALFQPEGKLQYCNISRKRRSDQNSLGWATVQLASVDEAKKAAGALQGKQFKGRALTVEPLKSIPRPARKPRVRKERQPDGQGAAETAEQTPADPCVVWVGNLPFSTTEETLQNIFAAHGEVKEIVITRDKRSKDSRGWGTVTYSSPEQADAAVSTLDGTNIEDRAIRVQIRHGPRPRARRRVKRPQQSAQAAEPAETDGKAAPRARRPFRRQPRRRRPAGGEGQSEAQGQEPKAEEVKQKPRARRPRNDTQRQRNEETVTIHTDAQTETKEGGRRRPRRPRKAPAAEGGAEATEQPTRPRRERKEPDRVVADPGCHLYIRNVNFASTAEDLKAYFEQKGKVLGATITVNPKGLSRGWGTVQMATPEDAQNALGLDKTVFQERALSVRLDNRVRGE